MAQNVQRGCEQQQSSLCFHAEKSKAALLTEPHCVAALKGLQEDHAFVHVFLRACALVFGKKSFRNYNPKPRTSHLKKKCPLQELHQAYCTACK